MNDVLEIINNGKVDQLTEHLNQVDTTGNIKFTHEQESEGQIPFLDTLIEKTTEVLNYMSIGKRHIRTNT